MSNNIYMIHYIQYYSYLHTNCVFVNYTLETYYIIIYKFLCYSRILTLIVEIINTTNSIFITFLYIFVVPNRQINWRFLFLRNFLFYRIFIIYLCKIIFNIIFVEPEEIIVYYLNCRCITSFFYYTATYKAIVTIILVPFYLVTLVHIFLDTHLMVGWWSIL